MAMLSAKVRVEEVMMTSPEHYTELNDVFHSNYHNNELSLSWDNLRLKFRTKKILRGVTGIAQPGELTAIMGPSGCGKTSLLNVLSSRKILSSEFQSSGTIKLNSTPINSQNRSNFIKYVMASSLLIPTLTPYESLYFSASFHFHLSTSEINSKVSEILEKFKISHVAHSLIGNELTKGISGSEKKMLSIALEMISEPPILIIDEATSGMDSGSALFIIHLLKNYSSSCKTVLITIHQPSQQIFEMIDTLILMTRGKFVYQGPRSSARNYFEEIGFKTNDQTPSSHYLLRILSQSPKILYKNYQELEKKIKFTSNLESLPLNVRLRPGITLTFLICIQKSLKIAKRDPFLLKFSLFHMLFVSLILGLLFFDLSNDRLGIENRKGLLFYIAVNSVMFGCMKNILTFSLEKQIFLKEYQEGLYGVFPYFFSKVAVEFVEALCLSLIFSIFSYFLPGLVLTAANYFTFLGILVLMHLAGMGIGYFCGVFAHNEENAAFLGYSSTLPLILFAGFFCKKENLSKSFQWISFVSPFHFGYQALAINEFENFEMDNFEFGIARKEIGIRGDLWENCLGLLLICFVSCVMALISLKCYALRKT